MTVAQRHLVIMARAPRLGAAKRRLARDVGVVAAQRFYRTQSTALMRRLGGDPRWQAWLALTPDHTAGTCHWPRRFGGAVVPQGVGDLGQRMGRLFATLPPGPVVIVGSDIPDIERRHVWEAFRQFGAHDWVFGPAGDGGYWLIGARRRPRLKLPFAGVRWSSSSALDDTLANLQRDRVAFLESLEDIDRGSDLQRWLSARKRKRR